MNTNGIEMFLAITSAEIVSLALFMYAGTLLLNFFKIPAQGASYVSSTSERRKIVPKPTITCSLPMHVVSRQEAPLY